MQQLGRIPGVRLIGTAADKASVMSFVLEGYSTEAVGKALNEAGTLLCAVVIIVLSPFYDALASRPRYVRRWRFITRLMRLTA